MKTLQGGIPGVSTFGGAQGPSLVKTAPQLPSEKVIAAGIPGVMSFEGIAGVGIEKVPAVTSVPIALEVELDRRRVFLTLNSRSLDAELTRRNLRTEIVK
ncbi:hypothetical protein [Streptomyces rubiginosohelvolus]|uniref:hypothetical protein n=1 Tax=Streptomyces rubiginosohelvolus TaxID=67362 RepID=UPI0036E3E8B3